MSSLVAASLLSALLVSGGYGEMNCANPSCCQSCESSIFDCYRGGCCQGGCGNGCCCCSCCRPLPSCWWLRGTCNLPPHYPYYPEAHGYYYFRPYHYSHIHAHRGLAAGWGGDPRAPYSSNGLFERIYLEMAYAPHVMPAKDNYEGIENPRGAVPPHNEEFQPE